MQRTVKTYVQYPLGREYSIRPLVTGPILRAARIIRANSLPIAAISAAAVFILMAAGLTATASAAAILSLLAVTLIPQ